MSTIQTTYGALAPVAAPAASKQANARTEDGQRPAPKAPAEEKGPGPQPVEASAEALADLQTKVNDELQDSAVHVRIDKHEGSARFVVKVLDANDELLHQFPSEDFLATSEQLAELRGLLFEAKG